MDDEKKLQLFRNIGELARQAFVLHTGVRIACGRHVLEVSYDEESKTIDFLFEHCEYYSEWFSPNLKIFCSVDDDRVVGFCIVNFHQVIVG